MAIRELAELLFGLGSSASTFSNGLTTLIIFLTLPVTTAAAERFYSMLKLIKNYLRSRMSLRHWIVLQYPASNQIKPIK